MSKIRLSITQWVVLGLAALTAFNAWFATRLDLVPDEAYYWMWSRHLDWAYRDKGPLVAWAISLSTHLFGDTLFGVRFFAVLLATAAAWEVFRLGRRLYDERIGAWCAAVTASIPLFAIGSIVMTIDSLSVYFWALACNLFLDALEKKRDRDWIYLGLAIGLGFLSKFTNGVQAVCIGLFLAWSPAHRRLLFSRQTLLMALAAAFCTLPIVYWNMREGWLEIAALHSRSGVEESFHFAPKELLKFLTEEALALSPLFFIGLLIACVGTWWKKSIHFREKFLLSQFWPLFALFFFFSLNRAGKANWIAPGLITGVIVTVVFWEALARKGKGWKILALTGLGLALLETAALHCSGSLPLKHDPVRRAKGWRDFAAHVQEARDTFHPDYLIANHYSQASEMTFYLRDHPRTYTPNGNYGANQFTLWGAYDAAGKTALFVTDDTDEIPPELKADFPEIRLVDAFWSMQGGRRMTEFRIYACRANKSDAVRP